MEKKYKSVLMSLAMIGLCSVFIFAGGASPTTTGGGPLMVRLPIFVLTMIIDGVRP